MGPQKESIQAFVERLLNAKGHSEVRRKERETLRNDLYKELDDFLTKKSYAVLASEEGATLKTLLSGQNQQAQIQQFFMDHIPNYEDFIEKALEEFEKVYLQTKSVQGAMEKEDLVPPPPPPAPRMAQVTLSDQMPPLPFPAPVNERI